MPVPHSIQKASNQEMVIGSIISLIEELRGGSKSTNTLKDLKLNYFLHTVLELAVLCDISGVWHCSIL